MSLKRNDWLKILGGVALAVAAPYALPALGLGGAAGAGAAGAAGGAAADAALAGSLGAIAPTVGAATTGGFGSLLSGAGTTLGAGATKAAQGMGTSMALQRLQGTPTSESSTPMQIPTIEESPDAFEFFNRLKKQGRIS
jgi:hypothetical protein